MDLDRKTNTSNYATTEDVSAAEFSADYGLRYLVKLVKQIRPNRSENYKDAEARFKTLLADLRTNDTALIRLQKVLKGQFVKRWFVPALTESGLIKSRGFLQELVKKLKHKVLPPLIERQNFLYVINYVFYRRDDYKWVEKIDRQLWRDLFELIGRDFTIDHHHIIQDLNEALHILSQRTITLGLEKEIMGDYYKVDYEEYSFFLLDQSIQNYLQLYKKSEEDQQILQAVEQIIDAVNKCKETINNISRQRRNKGTSLAQTYILIRLEQQLERLSVITSVLNCDNCFNQQNFLDYFIEVVRYESKKNSIREFISANLAFLAYKVTEHGGARGKKYITVTRQEYWSMITSAMGGGIIVSFTALIKALLGKFTMPPFWQGFAYSVNYAIGFQLMHETHTTLATKQPAYTASAIATSVDYFKAYEKDGLSLIAIIVARTSRTQLAAFFGNLVIVFPMGYGLAALYHLATGHLLLDQKAAMQILENQHPVYSLAVLYACFTGVFLFLSGLIGGYVDNGINYGSITERIKNNPRFRNTVAPKRLEKITNYIENNLGALAGNIALGFFLGMAGFIGKIFGIPFDIRHITISSGNSAMAYYTTGNTPGTGYLLAVGLGIFLIGLFNFLISFALAFTVAVRSRGFRIRDYPELLAVVVKYFFRRPIDFIFPPRSEINRTSSE